MPVKIIKRSAEYCTINKPFFALLLILMFICNYLVNLTSSTIAIPLIITVLMTGYGLEVTQNIIHGGTRLPKILPKKVLMFGVKGFIVTAIYSIIQVSILVAISSFLNFPVFEIEDLILNFHETIHLFLAHDILSGALFISSGLITVYITAFFMEISLAALANEKPLKKALNFPVIKQAIDIIGWRNYTIDYTKIILSVIILTYLAQFTIPNPWIDMIYVTVLYFLIFVIEFIGIGHVYKIYIDKKPN